MPKAGDNFSVKIRNTHINWGIDRKTNTRKKIGGEGFIPIPKKEAKRLEIYMSNHPTANTLYTCSSVDGFYSGTLYAQGNSSKGDVYAKNFAEKGDLKALGAWYRHVGAVPGGTVEVVFTSPTSLTIEYK